MSLSMKTVRSLKCEGQRVRAFVGRWQRKLAAQEQCGLRGLLQRGQAEANGESLTVGQIAVLEGISVANARKLMWILNKAGLVQSQRGTKGGYRLSRPASDIHLNEVISVL